MAAEDVALVLEEAKGGMHKSLESLQRELGRVRTGRANPGVLEGVEVDYYGSPTPLKSLATVNVPEPRLMTVQPFDKSSMQAVERAIMKADLGLTPSNDGKVIRVPVPELTEERRRDLVKQVKKMCEEHKVGVRNARRDAVSILKDLQKDGEVSEDESKQAQKKIQAMTDEFSADVDKAAAAKEDEILTI